MIGSLSSVSSSVHVAYSLYSTILSFKDIVDALRSVDFNITLFCLCFCWWISVEMTTLLYLSASLPSLTPWQRRMIVRVLNANEVI